MNVCKDKKGHNKVIHAFVRFCIAAIVGALSAVIGAAIGSGMALLAAHFFTRTL